MIHEDEMTVMQFRSIKVCTIEYVNNESLYGYRTRKSRMKVSIVLPLAKETICRMWYALATQDQFDFTKVPIFSSWGKDRLSVNVYTTEYQKMHAIK